MLKEVADMVIDLGKRITTVGGDGEVGSILPKKDNKAWRLAERKG